MLPGPVSEEELFSVEPLVLAPRRSELKWRLELCED